MEVVTMPQHKPRILVADPDRFMRESVCACLNQSFDTVQASCGAEALSIFRDGAVDAAIFDGTLGDMNGSALCAVIRGMKGGALVPIYVAGDEEDDAMLNASFGAGATDFFIKPVHLGLLAKRIFHDLAIAARLDAANVSPVERAGAESALFRVLPQPAILVGVKGIIFTANDAFERVFARRAAVAGMPVKELLGIDALSFEKEQYILTELASQGRGRVSVRVGCIPLGEGPLKGCSVFFVEERPSCEFPSVRTGARIIVLEDYDVVSRSLKRLLEKAGHGVALAVRAEDAVEQARELVAKKMVFDLAILDISLPGSSGGVEVLKILRELMPDLPAIVMSGAWNDPAMRNPSDFGFSASLKKPFSRDELMAVVNRILVKRAK
jgi:DNA-binding response OmpR family regulator